jgi:lysophospholipid acyltransferase (LPLAT)-like uncharacterized protein
MWLLASTVGRTWRHRFSGSDLTPLKTGKLRRLIVCFWHESLLIGFHAFRNMEMTALISASRDGERLSAVLQRWGYELIRGSSSRGGYSSVRQCTRALTEGRNLAMTPDGPRGPSRQLKPGIAHIALACSATVLPVSISAAPCVRLRSWDRFMIPPPFSSVRVHVGAPVVPQRSRGQDSGEQAMLEAIHRGLCS